jgi:hypothetical protein
MIFMLAAQAAATGDTPSVPGTYEVFVCRPECDLAAPEKALVRGIVVLMPGEFDPSEIPEPELESFRYGYAYDASPTGCFALDTLQAERTFAGINRVGFLRWFGSYESVRFDLYASADAGYKATVAITRDGFSGKGSSWGAGVAAPGYGPDVVVARRTGPPDLERCVTAARNAAHR